jgi:ribose transport system substrate-binding protein
MCFYEETFLQAVSAFRKLQSAPFRRSAVAEFLKEIFMKRNTLVVCAAALILTLSMGCSNSKKTASAQKTVSEPVVSKYPDAGTLPHYTVGVVIHTTTDFLCSQLKKYLDYLGENFNVTFKFNVIPSFADDVYLGAIQDLCSQGVDGIIATNFSGQAILQGLKICEENKVYLGIGFSQVDSKIASQAIRNPYYVGSSYEDDYNAGYSLIMNLSKNNCNKIAAIGYQPGILCHDRRWSGMMQAFKDHPEIKKVGEYRGLEFTKAVENFLAMSPDMNGVAITLLGMEYCSQPISAAGRTGKVKIACVDFADTSEQGLESGELVTTVGGQFIDAMFPFVLIYNRLAGTPLTDEAVEIPVNFITCTTAQQFRDYMKYVNGDVFPYTADEVKSVIKKFNPDANADTLKKWASTYSIDEVKTRHAAFFN